MNSESIKFKIQFFSHTSHITNVREPQGAGGCVGDAPGIRNEPVRRTVWRGYRTSGAEKAHRRATEVGAAVSPLPAPRDPRTPLLPHTARTRAAAHRFPREERFQPVPEEYWPAPHAGSQLSHQLALQAVFKDVCRANSPGRQGISLGAEGRFGSCPA